MRRLIILSPLFLFLLTGCPEKDQIKNMNQTELEKLDQCINDQKAKGLSILECGKDLKKSTDTKSNPTSSNNSKTEVKGNKGSSTKSNKKIKSKESNQSKTELNKIDECINRMKAKKLPYFKCLQK